MVWYVRARPLAFSILGTEQTRGGRTGTGKVTMFWWAFGGGGALSLTRLSVVCSHVRNKYQIDAPLQGPRLSIEHSLLALPKNPQVVRCIFNGNFFFVSSVVILNNIADKMYSFSPLVFYLSFEKEKNKKAVDGSKSSCEWAVKNMSFYRHVKGLFFFLPKSGFVCY